MDKDPGQPRVVIVGAGLAGLACGRRLKQAGIACTIFEANQRPGGRVFTGRGLFKGAESLHVELGGEFIAAGHQAILGLCSEFGLALDDLAVDEGLNTVFFAQGTRYTEAQVLERFEAVAVAIDRALATLQGRGAGIGYRRPGGAQLLDETSVAEFLQGAGGDAVINGIIRAALVSAYGRELDDQPALNLILAFAAAAGRSPFIGTSHQRYRVRGGNDKLVGAMAREMAPEVRYGRWLEAVTERAGGGYRLAFGGGLEVDCEVLVLTVPLSVLRRLELRVPMPDVKRRCIDELGYGDNAKLFVPFRRRFWRDNDESGVAYTDLGFQRAWAASRLQRGSVGVIANHVGGRRALEMEGGTASSHARRFIEGYAKLYPSAASEMRRDPHKQAWGRVKTARGSHASYLLGQWTGIGGAEGERVGDIFFCGEHTSPAFRGTMNGAVETAERVAREIASEMGRPPG